jgi:hypothetical protein
MSAAETSGSGISLASLLGVAFVVLKLCGVIAWSWWWVLLPFYGPIVLLLVILAIILIGGFILEVF